MKTTTHKLVKLEDVEEILSSELHRIWSSWFVFQHLNSTKENIDRWTEQSYCPYENLSEKDKEKDRKIAREIIKKFKKAKQYMHDGKAKWIIISVEEANNRAIIDYRDEQAEKLK